MTESALEPRLVALQEQIRESPGELIWMAAREEDRRPGPGGCFAPDMYFHRRENLSLGILSPDTATFDLLSAEVLPTTSYTVDDSWKGLQVAQGTWPPRTLRFLVWDLRAGLSTAMDYQNSHDNELTPNEHHIDVLVGIDAILAWTEYRTPFGNPLYGQLPHYVQARRLWLQERAELLGRPFHEAPELAAHRDQQARQQLDRLWELDRKLGQYEEQLRAIRAATKTGVLMRGGAVSVVEDEDDVRIHSLGPRREVDRLLGEMKAALERAGTLGYADHAYVRAFQLRYFEPED